MLVQGCVLVVMFLVVLPAFAGEPIHDATILDQVVAAQQHHTTVQGKLRWLTRQIADPTAPVREQQVRFFLAFPQRYHVIVTKADDQEAKQHFVSDGKTRWEITQLFEGEKPDVKTAPIGGDDEFERRLMACFRFDLASLQGDFSILAFATADQGAEIRLTPNAAKLKEQLSVLVLNFDAKRVLTAIRSDDPQGNRFNFVVQEAIYDQVLDDALFRVEPEQTKP
jgi:hypothetical protein